MHPHPQPISAEALAIIEHRRREVTAIMAGIAEEHPVITLELGSGHGHFLTAYAEAHPDCYCVGVDKQGNRIGRSLRKQDRAGLPNLRFVRAEVRQLLTCLPDRLRLARVLILFPDPWPKKRHHKNRLLSSDMLDQLARYALPGSDLFLRTDDFGYFEWVEAMVLEHPDWRLEPNLPWPFEMETVFQKKAETWQSLSAVRTDPTTRAEHPETRPAGQS